MAEQLRYHVGCGDTRLEGFVNVDVRETVATDLTADLNTFDLPGPIAAVFSHAFFEHLQRPALIPHLEAVRRTLAPDGFVCYIGLPDFRAIAEQYLAGGPGIVGPTFDLYNVYRYTHGDPEGVDYYYEQLHKSIFDVGEIARLVNEAGFRSHVTFTYVFPGEPVPVTLGFYATPTEKRLVDLESDCREFMSRFEGMYVAPGSLTFTGGETRGPILASSAVRTGRSSLRRFARALAMRLARI